jgi:peptide deformylase
MRAEDGLGMAAIQIGDPRRMFIVNPTLVGKAHAPPFVFINPEIISVSKETEETEEGCLSFPGVVVKVDRPVRARFRALNLYRKQFELEGEGLLARCMLHEYDHLIGRLMTDYGNK